MSSFAAFLNIELAKGRVRPTADKGLLDPAAFGASGRDRPGSSAADLPLRRLWLILLSLGVESSVHLYETHLAVADTAASQLFYTDVVGLEFAHRDRTRDIVFLWAGDHRRSMVGLWGPSTTYGGDFHRSHLAFAVSLDELLGTGERLRQHGVICQDFNGRQTDEPSVIGWMPSAQLYFRDPDGHSVEFIALLDGPPDPSFLGSLSEWNKA